MTDDLRKARSATDAEAEHAHSYCKALVHAERAAADAEIERLKAFIGCRDIEEKGVLAVGQALIDKDARIVFLESQNAECARGMDKLAKELAESQARADREYKLRMDESVKWSVELQKAQREIAEGKKREERLRSELMKQIEQWERMSDGDGGSIKIHSDKAARLIRKAMYSALSGGTDEAK